MQVFCTLFVVILWFGAWTPAAEAKGPIPIDDRANPILTSTSTGVRFKASSAPDTFYLYGGPGSIEGKFQDEHRAAGTLGHAPHAIVEGEWYGVDLTDPVSGDEAPYVGDFSWIVPVFQDIDPCRENSTPAVGFIDDGRCPSNEDNNGGLPPCDSTGGTTMLSEPYGVPGGWAVNYTGGLSFGLLDLRDEVWSPPIAWDLPGTADDGAEVAGARLRFSVWRDLYVFHDLFYVWHVRTSHDGGATWSDFVDDGGFYYGSDPRWINLEIDVSSHVHALGPPTHVQIALGVLEFPFGPPGNNPTPSPVFDNVTLLKYRVTGPAITAVEAYTFMDAFPQSGNADFATLAGRELSDCRLDVADVGTGIENVPGDSMVVDVVPVIAGTTVQDVRAVWVVDVNPLFDDVRSQPAGVTVVPNGALNGFDQWFGELAAHPVGGVENRWSLDFPDEAFLYPGDRLRYYVQATDSDGRVSTLPSSLDGFDVGYGTNNERYDPVFSVQGLPSVFDDGNGGVTQPWVLIVNGAGFTGGLDELRQVLQQNGVYEGVESDVYTVRAPTARVSNGIGSAGAHGATAEQLSGYEAIVYTTESLRFGPSNGDASFPNDKGDDLGVLTAWFQQDADRSIAYFGDGVVTALVTDAGASGTTYAQSILGVDWIDADVTDEVGRTPRVAPTSTPPCFYSSYVVYGGCPGRNTFDAISPRPGAEASHVYTDPQGVPLAGPAAGVVWLRDDGNGHDRNTAVFPYGLASIWDASEPDASQLSRRSRLFGEVVSDCFGVYLGYPSATAAPPLPLAGLRALRATPNPFNGVVTVAFELGAPAKTTVRIYDVRGQRVRTLHDGQLPAGAQVLRWNGRDDRGANVSSGVYLVKVEANGQNRSIKTAYVK